MFTFHKKVTNQSKYDVMTLWKNDENKTILSHHSVFLTSLRICKLSTKVSFSSIFRDSKLRIIEDYISDYNAK